MTITIKQELLNTLTELAQGQGRTVEEYVEHIMNKHLMARYKEDIVKDINLDNLDVYKNAINEVRLEIITEKDKIIIKD
jgi:hypothetical protein